MSQTITNHHRSADAAAESRGRIRPEGRRSFLSLMAFFGVIFLAVIVVQLSNIYSKRSQMVGDGQTVASYGYDLSTFLGDRDLLVASGRAKDAMPALGELTVVRPEDFEDAIPLPGAGPLDTPGAKAITAGVVDRFEGKPFQRPIVGSDRVVGLSINGEARAYPIRYLRWHEIINDTLGGEPVAVTYSVPCDSAAAFDRRVDGETLNFGFSGLLYNSNLLMYDRRPDPAPEGTARPAPDGSGDEQTGSAAPFDRSSEGESLWSQLGFRAIAGPAAEAGHALDVLPLWYGTFAEWRERHPETTVFIGDPAHEERYEREPVEPRYFETGELLFPVAETPPEDGPLRRMAPVAAFRTGSEWRVRPTDRVEPGTIPADAPRVHARWFAWYAFHGAEGLVLPSGENEPESSGDSSSSQAEG